MRWSTTSFAPSAAIGLGHRDEGPQQLHASVRAKPQRLTHRLHEILTAVRIDRVVTGVRRDNEAFRAQLSARPPAMESIMPFRKGTTVCFMFAAA